MIKHRLKIILKGKEIPMHTPGVCMGFQRSDLCSSLFKELADGEEGGSSWTSHLSSWTKWRIPLCNARILQSLRSFRM